MSAWIPPSGPHPSSHRVFGVRNNASLNFSSGDSSLSDFFFYLPVLILVNPWLYLLDILTSGPQEPEIFVCLFVFVLGFGNDFSYGF